MPEKKRLEKKPFPELKVSAAEIFVANGRSFEPFIKTFSYSGENITKVSLGVLVGVFEVDEKSDDSAYIVNFLVSVAKKEYFNNPRRGAVESFEAALHKINLALAELVKHGNVSWLGKFHGALGVFEKNNLHFSATGDACILLVRNENISDIAQGLASSESHIHPIKTFVEVSSGRLLPKDKVIMASPELLALFSLEDLVKNAIRMNEEHFKQFLRTALVNELNIAGAIVSDLKENISASAPKILGKNKIETHGSNIFANVFSKATFIESKKKTAEKENKLSDSINDVPNDYVDTKTGHIYVQGDSPGKSPSHPLLERMSLNLQDLRASLYSLILSQRKWFHKIKKASLIAFDTIDREAHAVTKMTVRALREQWKRSMVKQKVAAAIPFEGIKQKKIDSPPTMIAGISEKPVCSVLETNTSQVKSAVPSILSSTENKVVSDSQSVLDITADVSSLDEEDAIPPFMREKLAKFYGENHAEIPKKTDEIKAIQQETGAIRYVKLFIKEAVCLSGNVERLIRQGFALVMVWSKLGTQSLQTILQNFTFFYRRLTPPHKKIMIGGIILILFVMIGIAIGFFVIQNKPPQNIGIVDVPKAKDLAPVPFTETKKGASLANAPVTLITKTARLVTTIILDNEVYLISSKSLIHISDDKEYPLPNESSIAKFAAAMDDLRLIFIVTENNEVFSFSPISHTFSRNTLALPTNASIKNIGTYLTYLYVLDSVNNQIYRFPRADGGFGQPVAWLRDNANIEDDALLAVNETIYLASTKSSLQAFFRGRFVKNFESPNTLSLVSIFSHPGTENIYGLDRDRGLILVWNQAGALLAQYFSDKLSDAQTITVNEKTNEVIITTANSVFSFKLEK